MDIYTKYTWRMSEKERERMRKNEKEIGKCEFWSITLISHSVW